MSLQFDIHSAGGQIAAGVRAFGSVAPKIIQSPRAYPKEAMLLASIGALLVLVFFLLAYALATWVASLVRRRRLGVNPYRGRAMRVGLALTVAGSLAMLGLTLAPFTLGGSESCTTCHGTVDAAAAWRSGSHASVACYGCHAAPTVLGGVQVGVQEFARYLGAEGPGPATTSRRCLGCHDELKVKLSEVDGLRVSHREIISSGVQCIECHRQAGHESPVQRPQRVTSSGRERGDVSRPLMSRCLVCHDGERAPSACATCHEDGPLDRASATSRAGAGTITMKTTCRGCHDSETQGTCIDCHGLEMPHPASFRSQHAGMSWKQPTLCTKCHDTAAAADGCACHVELTIHGTYSEWFPRHMEEARQAGPSGCRCHKSSECEACHVGGAPNWKTAAGQP